jgi:hypothetical protein
LLPLVSFGSFYRETALCGGRPFDISERRWFFNMFVTAGSAQPLDPASEKTC